MLFGIETLFANDTLSARSFVGRFHHGDIQETYFSIVPPPNNNAGSVAMFEEEEEEDEDDDDDDESGDRNGSAGSSVEDHNVLQGLLSRYSVMYWESDSVEHGIEFFIDDPSQLVGFVKNVKDFDNAINLGKKLYGENFYNALMVFLNQNVANVQARETDFSISPSLSNRNGFSDQKVVEKKKKEGRRR